jgi:uncharacterized membrane protein
MPTLPKWLSEVGWRTVIGGLLLGGIVHILATFAVPFVSPGHAFSKLRDSLPVNRMVILPPPAPGKQALPFLTPDAVYGLCRYDLSVDSLMVNVTMAHAGWTLSMHTPQGENFYVMPAQALRKSDITLTVVPGVDRLGEFHAAPKRVGQQDTNIAAPAWEGLVMVRAPLRGLAWRAETEAWLRRATCTPVKRQQ